MRNDFSSNYLAHHGILGQKWGVRRFQNEDGSLTATGKKRYGSDSTNKIVSAKGIQNRLNDVDTAIARNKRAVNDGLAKSKKYNDKANKLEEKLNAQNPMKGKVNIENDKLNQYRTKSAEGLSQALKAQKMIDAGNKQVNSLIKQAQKNGYTMTSKEIQRDVSDGREVLKSMAYTVAFSMILGPTAGVIGAGTVHKTVKGTQYKVKEQKKK